MEALQVSNEGDATPAAQMRQSLLRYSPALLLFTIAIADAGRWADPDLWGHLIFGRLILEHGRLPARDIYSYSAFGMPWHDHEWLSEVVLALCWSSLGVIGLKLMKFALSAATMTLLAMGAAQTGAPVMLQLVVLTTDALALGPMLQFRPQLFDFLELSALMLLFARDTYCRAGGQWIAVPMFALWANLHGGFIIGLAVFALYTAAVAVGDALANRSLVRARNLTLLTAICALVTLLNPYGIGDWSAVMHTLGNPLTRAMVSEWQPLGFKIAEEWQRSPLTAINFALAIVPAAALAASLLIRPRGGDDFALVAIAGMMAAAALLAVRNLALMVIASTVPLCRHGAMVLADAHVARRSPERRGWRREAAVAPVTLVVLLATGLFSRGLPDGYPQPHGAAAFMRARGLRGNVLCDFAWGEFLIFHLAPHSRVFIDSRYDMVYPRSVLADYLDFILVRPRAARVLAAYPHDFVLMPTRAPVCRFMTSRSGWRRVYSDEAATLFARADLAAHLGGVTIGRNTGSFP